MGWGLPPKEATTKNYDWSQNQIIWSVQNALQNCDFEIEEITSYTISASKKQKWTIMSVLAFSRPYVNFFVRVPDGGSVHVESVYEFNSYIDSPFYDKGRQKKEIKQLLVELDYIIENSKKVLNEIEND